MDKIPDFKSLYKALNATDSLSPFGVTKKRAIADKAVESVFNQITKNPDFRIDKKNLKIADQTLKKMAKMAPYFSKNQQYGVIQQLLTGKIQGSKIEEGYRSRSGSMSSGSSEIETRGLSRSRSNSFESSEFIEVPKEASMEEASEFVERMVDGKFDPEKGVMFSEDLNVESIKTPTVKQNEFISAFQSALSQLNIGGVNSTFPPQNTLSRLSIENIANAINQLSNDEFKALIGTMSLSQIAILKAYMEASPVAIQEKLFTALNKKHAEMAEGQIRGLYSQGLVMLAKGINDEFPLSVGYGKNPQYYKRGIDEAKALLQRPITSSSPLARFTSVKGKLNHKEISDLMKAFTLAFMNENTTAQERGQIRDAMVALRHLYSLERGAFDPSKKVELKFADPTVGPYLERQRGVDNYEAVAQGENGKSIYGTNQLRKDVNRMDFFDATGGKVDRLSDSETVDSPETAPKVRANIKKIYDAMFSNLRRLHPEMSEDRAHELAQDGLNNLAQQTQAEVTGYIAPIRSAYQMEYSVKKDTKGLDLNGFPVQSNSYISVGLTDQYYSLEEVGGEIYLQIIGNQKFVDMNDALNPKFQTIRTRIPISDPGAPWSFELFPDTKEQTKFVAQLGLPPKEEQ